MIIEVKKTALARMMSSGNIFIKIIGIVSTAFIMINVIILIVINFNFLRSGILSFSAAV